MILYIGKSNDFTEVPLKVTMQFNKVIDYEINTQDPIAFVYLNNAVLEK